MAWRTGYTIPFDDLTPAKTVYGKADFDLAALGARGIHVTVTVIFGGSADGDAYLTYRHSADGGTTVDSIDDTSLDYVFTVSAGATLIQSKIVMGYPWLRIGVYNGNTAVEDITISGKYALLY